MKMEDWINEQQESVQARLGGAQDAAAVIRILDDTAGRMLIQYTQECTDPDSAAQAGLLISAARSVLPAVDCLESIQVWERTPSSNRIDKKPVSFWVSGAAGLLLLLISLLAGAAHAPGLSRLILILITGLGGGVLLFLAGGLFRGHSPVLPGSKKEYLTQPRYDAGRLFSSLRLLAVCVDQSLEEYAARSRDAEPEASKTAGGDLSDQEDILMLCSGLLEAAASGDGQYALDEIGQVKYFLHRHQIETASYTPEHRAWFEAVPAAETGTLRPALIHAEDGRLLRKGLAGIAS